MPTSPSANLVCKKFRESARLSQHSLDARLYGAMAIVCSAIHRSFTMMKHRHGPGDQSCPPGLQGGTVSQQTFGGTNGVCH